MRGPANRRGVTLMELLVAVSLLSLLSVGMLMAMRAGLDAMNKANERLMDNRRVAGVERILHDQIAGFVPVTALCMGAGENQRARVPFFQGEPRAMRFVSTYSLEEAWRGQPRILEYLVVPGENGLGVRLLVNEILYTGPLGAGELCMPPAAGPDGSAPVVRFRPVAAGPRSFVLADKLAACSFQYLEAPAGADAPDNWRSDWSAPAWPQGIRVDMQPLDPGSAHLHPVSITAAIRVTRSPGIQYGDF
jgi:prepilin-type N-terminal cleavage/methylation domain-containing protein